MKHILIFILLCFASELWAQYPNGANKLVLGRQTTGDGLIFRGDSIPSFTPTSNANAWFFLDTAAQVLYTHIGGTWVSLADTITSGGTVTLSGEVVGASNATKLDTVDRVIFDPTNGGADSTYKLTYNANDFTLHFGMGLGGEVYQMGQELYYPPCINKTASTIYAGQPVMIDTSGIIQGDRLAVMPAFANGLPANYIVGVAAHDISPDAEGLVTWFGYVREVDEADIAASGVTLDVGDILYLSATPGKYSDTEPAAPAINSTIALVVRKPNANNMTLLVRPWLNEKLGELTDVDLSGIADGDALVWDSISGTWQTAPKQDPLTGTGLVKSTGGTISYVTDNSADWNAAYNDRITGAAFTGSTTKTLTLTQQDAGTVTASFTDLQGVTSVATGVGLSGGTITTTGTISADTTVLVSKTFLTNQGYTSNVGTVTSVATGVGLSGGTITSSGTISADTTVLASKTWTETRGYLTAEVDGSVTNEGSLTVGAGTGTTSVINSNTSGSTGVTISASTGLSISEAGNTITLTNSAPDQTVSLTGAGITSISGTYPSFTITSTEVDGSTTNELQNLTLSGQSLGITSGSGVTLPVVGITAGTGISSSSASGDFTITNSAPEATSARNINATGEGVYRDEVSNELQFKKLVAGSNITLTGADSTITIASTAGGTGTVTSITAGTGLTGGTITTSGTIAADTSLISTKDFAKYQSPIIGLQNTVGNNFLFGRPQQKDTILYRGDGGVSIYDYETTTFNSNNKVVYGIALTGQALALHNLSTNGIISRTGAGTVAARTLTAGTGISISNGDGVSANPTITNSAPDQTVSITGAGINSVSGTYPNFTITGTEVDGSLSNEGSLTVGAGASNTSIINSNTSGSTGVTIEASTGLTIAESGSTITLTNSAPDQTVSISGAGINSVSGTYPNFTITGTEVDGSTTNELQNLSLTGQTLGISSGSGVTLPVVGITAGTGISTTSASGDFTITNSAPEATTARNVNATGEGVFRDEVGNELQFKKLVAGSNITLTGADSTVTIAASGGGTGTVTSITAGTGLTGGTITTSGTIAADTSVLSTVYALSDTASNLRTVINAKPSGSGAANKIAYWSDSNTLTSDTDLHWDAGNNRLGIGVSSPAYDLSLASGTRTIGMPNVTGTPGGFFTIRSSGAGGGTNLTGGMLILEAGYSTGLSGSEIVFNTAKAGASGSTIRSSTESMRISQEGRLGINTTSPARLLHVEGEARITDLTTDTPTRIVGADADGDLGEITTGNGLTITSGALRVDTATIATVYALADTASTLRALIPTDAIIGARNVNPTGEGVFRDEVGNELEFKKLVAGSNITLTGADSTITIAGNAGTVTSIATNNGITGGTITDSGTIGLTGNALALHQLATNGIIARTGISTLATRSITAGTGISVSNGDGVSGNPTISVDTATIATVSAVRDTASTLRGLIAAAGGDFGTVAANKVAFGAASGDTLTSNTNLHWDNTNGRLGINNTSPAERLQVGGNIRGSRLIFGEFSTQTLSINNYAPAGSQGFNLFIGNGGQNAVNNGVIIEEGARNIGIGEGVLFDNTTGYYNTGIGTFSLSFTTTGIGNVALGNQALYFNTTGSRNFGLGTAALLFNSSGSDNIAIGNTAGYSILGSNNITIGSEAIQQGTGSNNTLIGHQAGYFHPTSGYITTLDNSTLIGYDTRPSASGNTNEIVIGYQGRGNGSNTTTLGNTSTTGTFLAAGNLNLTGQAATVMQTARHTTAGQAGNNLTIKVGGAASGATNAAGGNLILESGVSTGNAGSKMIFKTAIGGASGTTDRSPSEAIHIDSEGDVGIGARWTNSGDPESKLSVHGNVTIGTGYNNLSLAAPTNGVIIEGKVGIGQISPTATLHLDGNFSRGQLTKLTTLTSYTLNDLTSWISCEASGTTTLTLPNAASYNGREIMVKVTTNNTVVSASSNVVPLAGGSAGTAILPATAGKWATLVSDGTNWIIMQAN